MANATRLSTRPTKGETRFMISAATDFRISVLLVETDPVRRRMISRLLSERCRVSVSTHFHKIVEMLRCLDFHTLCVDHALPSPGAVALLTTARRVAPNTKRVLMPGDNRRNLQRYLETGLIQGYIQRNAASREILEAIVRPPAD
jgi:DNA-binding NarL/FixJ family response regulator